MTFRLADSLPANVIAQLKEDRAVLVQNAMGSGRPLTWREERELFLWYSNAVDGLLDACTGSCWLARCEIAALVARALCFFEGQRYEFGAWVLMPNHVHVVVTPIAEWTLSQILHTWKSYTAKGANRLLQRVGKFWQTESFDHRIRSDDELAATAIRDE